MPVSGVTMGIFGGKGIPFFGLGTVPGLSPKESGLGWVAGKAFKLHKQAGQILPDHKRCGRVPPLEAVQRVV